MPSHLAKDNISGSLIDIRNETFIKGVKGYNFNDIPKNFLDDTTGKTYVALKNIIQNVVFRTKISKNALNVARTKFSIETRNQQLLEIYNKALST